MTGRALTTTLAEIRAASPCEEGWRKLLRHLGKTAAEAKADTAEIPLSVVLDGNGMDDALWVLDCAICNQRIIALFAADCAERVLPIFEREMPGDDRPRRAIEAARDQNLSASARGAAWEAACASARAARAARASARAAAWASARAAAWAALDSARAAALDSAGAPAWEAARAAQSSRLRQYCEHGEAAASMPWPDAVPA